MQYSINEALGVNEIKGKRINIKDVIKNNNIHDYNSPLIPCWRSL